MVFSVSFISMRVSQRCWYNTTKNPIVWPMNLAFILEACEVGGAAEDSENLWIRAVLHKMLQHLHLKHLKDS